MIINQFDRNTEQTNTHTTTRELTHTEHANALTQSLYTYRNDDDDGKCGMHIMWTEQPGQGIYIHTYILTGLLQANINTYKNCMNYIEYIWGKHPTPIRPSPTKQNTHKQCTQNSYYTNAGDNTFTHKQQILHTNIMIANC